MDLDTILDAVDAWPVEDRLRLMHELLDRLAAPGQGPGLTDAQKAELDSRLADDDASPDDLVAWDEVKAEALARIRR